MNYFSLAHTTPDVLEKIAQAEKDGRYSEHLDPIDYTNCNPVDGSFQYIPQGAEKRRQLRDKFFIINPFDFMLNKFVFHTKVYGKENLKGIDNAVVTCNHINKYDALAVRRALKGHNFKVMVGDFNNQKGRLGDFMRAYGIMPFSTNRAAFKNFDSAVTHYLNNGTYILFFPERSEWWCYEKPRPYMDGAYHYAVKNGVAVVPIFITFTMSGKKDENGIEMRNFHVHILKPIFADKSLSSKENAQRMKEINYEMCKAEYERFYKRKLEY